ncbi:MAG: hypothetical protein RL077_1860, partial [Verrucomicrobiota bacterium]
LAKPTVIPTFTRELACGVSGNTWNVGTL